MSNASLGKSGDIMAPLRAVYLKDLVTRQELISDFCMKLEAGDATKFDREEMQNLAHKLAGTGATYGYPDISAMGAQLEDQFLAQVPASDDELLQSAKSLLKVCHAAHEQSPVSFTQSAPQAAPASDAGNPSLSTGLPLVMIVDDDRNTRQVLGGLIRDSAHIIMCGNAQEAFEKLQQKRPDLILLDDNMPGEKSGMRLLEDIKRNPSYKAIPIIMITGSDRPESVMRGLAAGAVDYMIKPFDPDKTGKRIRQRLQRIHQRVLIVEDDTSVCELLNRKFQTCGYACDMATDGITALKMMEDMTPDLVILDRMLPGMDGMTVLQMMRKNPTLEKTPVLMLTAKRQEADVLAGFELGASDYVIKPFNVDEVVARCTRLLSQPVGFAA